MSDKNSTFSSLKNDFFAGLVVFLVALPLCLGIALASGAPLFSGIITGFVGGLIVAWLSGSRFSVSGPAAGLSAVVLSAIHNLGAYETFLLAVVLSGVFQIGLGIIKAGHIANYFPSPVIKGLLTAIGIILILKQIPHAFGYDKDNEGDFEFLQSDKANTFSEILNAVSRIEIEATAIALISVLILIFWERKPKNPVSDSSQERNWFRQLLDKRTLVPAPLLVVAVGVGINELIRFYSPEAVLGAEHLVNMPISKNIGEFFSFFRLPDFSQILNGNVWLTAATLSIVASLETLLNLEATDKLDLEKRQSPKNRELLAQGVGNMITGMLGGIPMTSVIVRSSVNINSGAKTKLSAFFHGVFLFLCAVFIPDLLNKIPLSALAAILLVTGFKLAKAKLFVSMYKKGFDQFFPFIFTVVVIVFTDLLIGVISGLCVSVFFVLRSNFKTPFSLRKENFHTGEVLMIKLSEQVSFLNKASFINIFEKIPDNSQVMLDAQKTDFIDADVLEIIHEFQDYQAPAKNVSLSLIGFKEKYKITNNIRFVTHTSAEVQRNLSPKQVLKILKDGNQRFLKNIRLERNLLQEATGTAKSQFPLAAILGCIDSRTSSELIFDLGLGDIFSIRLAGNIANEDVLGSMEFACKVSGAKLIVVLGHTNCGAIKAACDGVQMGNLSGLVNRITPAVDAEKTTLINRSSKNTDFVENVTKLNVKNVMEYIRENSPILKEMLDNQEIALVGGVYEVESGEVFFYENANSFIQPKKRRLA